MKLKQLIKSLGDTPDIHALEDFDVAGLACDSKKVSDNFIFVAIKGNNIDGHSFIKEALNKGARGVIVQIPNSLPVRQAGKSQIPKNIAVIEVKDTRQALAKLAAEFYGNPSKKVKVIGITGTNGKTTISYLIEAILQEAGYEAAVIGTVNYRFKNRVINSKNTTPGPLELQVMLADILKEGIDYTVMEVSSHALDQHRTDGINFRYAIFTNLSQDHLDYHHNLEDYFEVKSRLFKSLKPESCAIINQDDAYARRLNGLTCAKLVTYGIEDKAQVRAENIIFDINHTEFILSAQGNKIKFRTLLIGRHNVYNVLASISLGLKEGLDLSVIRSAVEKFKVVPGRLQRIDFKGDFAVFVDYAHTEDALSNVITTLRQVTRRKVIVVFGCGGERDKTKRPKMGQVVSELADYAVITSDNPRSENPESIIEDIKKGIKKQNFSIMADRRDAIKKALTLAKTGDIVLIAGKGHENYQILKDKVISFDDCQVVRECLK